MHGCLPPQIDYEFSQKHLQHIFIYLLILLPLIIYKYNPLHIVKSYIQSYI